MEEGTADQLINGIPIQNIYFMFCYAWKHFKADKETFIGSDNYSDLLNLLAHVVVEETSALVRRGIERQYIEMYEDVSAPKGRIVMGETVKRNLLHRQRVHCVYDDLSPNILHNQIVLSTLLKLVRTKGLDPKQKQDMQRLIYRFEGVDRINLRTAHFKNIRVHRNNLHYRLLLNVCQLICEALQPNQNGMDYKFKNPVIHDPRKMGLVFEEFIRNFLKHEQNEFTVEGKKNIEWVTTEACDSMRVALPDMETDISLRSVERYIIVETKFYEGALVKNSQYTEANKKVRPDHLYQLFAYIKNKAPDLNIPVEGILLYPTVGDAVDSTAMFQGHKIRVVSINLNQHWSTLKTNLLSLLH